MGFFGSVYASAKKNIQTKIKTTRKKRKMRKLTKRARYKYLFTTEKGQKELYSITKKRTAAAAKSAATKAKILYLKQQKATLQRQRSETLKKQLKKKKVTRKYNKIKSVKSWMKDPRCIICGKKLKNTNKHMCKACYAKYE